MFPGNMFYGIRKTINHYCGRNINSRIPFSIIHGIINSNSAPLFYKRQPLSIWCNNKSESNLYVDYMFGSKILGAPFLYHLLNQGIKPFSKNIKLGTGILILPSHSTYYVNSIQNHEAIVDNIISLVGRSNLKNVTVHVYGINLSDSKFYRKNGIKTTTSGYSLSQNFFYDFTNCAITHAIVAANQPTSGLLYCATLGLKVAQLNVPVTFKGFDPNVGIYNPYNSDLDQEFWQRITSTDWLEFAAEKLGFNHLLSPNQMLNLIYDEDKRLREKYYIHYMKTLSRISLHRALEPVLHLPLRTNFFIQSLLYGKS